MNIFKTTVSRLPVEGDYFYGDLSEFKLLKFVYQDTGGYNFIKLRYEYNINDGHTHTTLAIAKRTSYQDCMVIRNVEDKSFTLSCIVNDSSDGGMQIIDCAKKGYVFVIPNWDHDISFISDEASAYVPDLARYCLGSESAEVTVA